MFGFVVLLLVISSIIRFTDGDECLKHFERYIADLFANKQWAVSSKL